MSEWVAPAKLNFSLEVGPAGAGGYHPLRSLVQTIDWCDSLAVEAGDDDRLRISGALLPDDGQNLVWRAVELLAPTGSRPALDIELDKRVPIAAGLGGGSSDAAAALVAVADLVGFPQSKIEEVAPSVGADVPFFLVGGSALMEGRGERITELSPLGGFAVAVVVPPFELSTAEVYRHWDRMGEPRGSDLSDRGLPPALRAFGGLRNDLTAAAIALEPDLADWITDLAREWGRPVAMTGSGPALFACFTDLDEAEAAAAESPSRARATAGATLRRRGVGPAD